MIAPLHLFSVPPPNAGAASDPGLDIGRDGQAGAAPVPEYEIRIWGKPIAKKRPQFSSRRLKKGGKFVKAVNTQETEESRVLHDIENQWKADPLDKPLCIKLYFGMPIPKSTSNKRKRLMIRGLIKHDKRPDLDNLEKFYKDVCNGIVWVDDSQIYRVMDKHKFYAERPFTLIQIMEG